MSLDLPYRGVALVTKVAFLLAGYRFTYIGRENVPRRGGAVLAINHTAYPDFLMAGMAARKQHRWVRFMAKKSIWSHRYAGPVMRALKHIPVDRRSGAAAYRMAVESLKAGEVLGVYPEATMSRSFEIKELKPGAVRMAREAGVPVLPTIVWGAHRIWTKDVPKNFTRSHIPIHVSIGEPIHVAPDADVKAVTQELRATMQRMLDEVIAAYPPLTGDDLRFLPARLGGTAPSFDDAYGRDLKDMTRTTDEFNG